MSIGLQLNRIDRRLVLASLAWLFGAAADAQEGVLSSEGLEKLIRRTLAEPDTTPLSRPAILGLGPTAWLPFKIGWPR